MTLFLIFCLVIWLAVVQSKVISLEKYVNRNKRFIRYNLDQGLLKRPERPIPNNQTLVENEAQEQEQTDTLQETNTNFENMFLGNVFNKVGAVAILIGLAIFIKLVTPFFIFTPIIKILLGTIFAALVLWGGLKLNNNEKFKAYSEVTIGLGLASLFITLYCATSLYHLISTPIATIIAMVFTMAGFFLADRLKTASSVWLMLLAGYINPYLINPHLSQEYLFGYFIILNLISSVFVYRNFDKSYINIVNLILTAITLSGMTYFSFEGHTTVITGIIGLWAIYVLFDIMQTTKNNDQYYTERSYIQYVNFGVLTFLTITLFYPTTMMAKLFFAGTLLAYTALTCYYKKIDSVAFKPSLYSTIISLGLCTLFTTTDTTRIVLFAVEALALAYFSTENREDLKFCSQIFYTASALLLIFDENNLISALPFLNLRAVAFITVILSALTTNYYFIKKNIQNREFFQYLAIAVGFFYIQENALILRAISRMEYLVSLLWVLYAGAITTIGILKQHKALLYSGIILSILTTIRIFSLDLAELSSLYKTIALFSLGVVLLLVSYLYTKYSNKK